MGLNLHKIVRGAISSIARDLPCDLYLMTGDQVRGERGDMRPVFLEPVKVKAQWQSVGPDAIVLTEKISMTTTVRKVYLYADSNAESRPWGAWRPLGRSGDLLRDDKGNFWLVDVVLEDFTHEGWVSVQAVLQTIPPKFYIKGRSEDGCC